MTHALSIECPQCKSPIGLSCIDRFGNYTNATHFSRTFVANDLATRRDPDPELRIAPLRDYVPDPVPAPKPPF